MSIGLITELEVVNSVLSTAGDSPIQTLDDTYQPAFIIKTMINNVSRDLQTKKYWFNTEYEVTLSPNTQTSKITLPYNMLKFEPEDTKYVSRGLSVYDKEARTTIIEEEITADITLMLKFSELPQEARKYIEARCKMQYNDEYFGEDSLRQTLAQGVQEAKLELDRTHLENMDINVLSSTKATSIAFKNRTRGS